MISCWVMVEPPSAILPLTTSFTSGPGDAAEIDAAMFIKTGVLNGHHRLLQENGDAVDGDPVALLRQDPADEPALVVKHLDGTDAGRLGGIAGEGLLGRRGRGQTERQRDAQQSRTPWYSTMETDWIAQGRFYSFREARMP